MNRSNVRRIFPDESLHAMWLERIDASASASELGRLIVDFAESYVESMHATVLWDLSPHVAEDGDAQTWLRKASASGIPQYDGSRNTIAFRLCGAPQSVLLLLKLQPGCRSEAIAAELLPTLQLAGRR